MSTTGRVIGIDFDNTLADYGDVVHRLAVKRGLVAPVVAANKREIRDSVRRRDGGELEWQQLQAELYGPKMLEARLSDGVEAFAQRCRRHGARLVIVSHKTEVSPLNPAGVNLRTAARAWMTEHGVCDSNRVGVAADDVYFEDTRMGKIARIQQLGCTQFIDDLEETFLEPSFPETVERLLYVPAGASSPGSGIRVFNTWQAIGDYLFGS